MRNSRLRLGLIAAAAIAALLLVLASVEFVFSQRTARASHAGGADAFLIDMDPTGNTATSVGTVQDCARINKNGVQDADEDAVDTVFADVVALNIPVGHPIIAFEVKVRHGTGVVIDSGDFSQMLAANPGSAVSFTDVFQTESDTTVMRAIDSEPPLTATAETGSGVLVTAAFRATTGGPLVQAVTLLTSAHVDPANNAFVPDNSFDAGFFGKWLLPSSRIAVDQACPLALGPGDLAVGNVQFLTPTALYADERFPLQIVATLTNLGPAVVSDYALGAIATVGIWPDCRDFSGPWPPIVGPPVPAGGSVFVVSTRLVSCSTPGVMNINGRASVIVLDSIDTNLGNNVLTASPASVTILANDPDGDGVGGAIDLCPETPPGTAVDALGCSLAQADSDGDGVCDDNAPSNGPSPGCVRGVAVGGMVGLIGESKRTATAGPGNAGSSSSPVPVTLPSGAAGIAALGAAAAYLRRRRV